MKRGYTKTNYLGFTLIEILVALVLLVTLTGMLVLLSVNYTSFFEKQAAQVNVNLSSRFVLDEITNSVRQAAKIANQFSWGEQTFQTGEETLILLLPSLNQNGQVILGYYDFVIFYQDQANPKKVVKKIIPNVKSTRKESSQTLTSDLKEIHFFYNNIDPTFANEVNIDLTMVQIERAQPQEIRDRAKILLRNF